MTTEITEPDCTAAIHFIEKCDTKDELALFWQSVKKDVLINDATRKKIYESLQKQLADIKALGEEDAKERWQKD